MTKLYISTCHCFSFHLYPQDGRFNMLTDALEKSGYIQELRRMSKALTILAPSDEAFQKLPEKRLEKILNDKAARHGKR